jgi:hypothetical protein
MLRVALPVVLATVMILGVIGSAPPHSNAQAGTPEATSATGECTDRNWKEKDFRPPDPHASRVFPALLDVTPVEGSPTPHEDRELYLLVISLPPGACVPYAAPGNQKTGAVVWIVQQGKVEFAWRLVNGANPGGMPIIKRGNSATVGDATPITGITADPGTAQILYPGDWVTQDRQVAVAYRNSGGDTAIILKAVYALPSAGGCPGDCR